MEEEKIELKDEERQECEIWTRVMGYFRPTSNFNKGKVSEFNDRTYFKESIATKELKQLLFLYVKFFKNYVFFSLQVF